MGFEDRLFSPRVSSRSLGSQFTSLLPAAERLAVLPHPSHGDGQRAFVQLTLKSVKLNKTLRLVIGGKYQLETCLTLCHTFPSSRVFLWKNKQENLIKTISSEWKNQTHTALPVLCPPQPCSFPGPTMLIFFFFFFFWNDNFCDGCWRHSHFFFLKKKKFICLAALSLGCCLWDLVPWPMIKSQPPCTGSTALATGQQGKSHSNF